ncbi:hypothetical protein [Shinella oryzae]|uniref:PH domain-containing protein n=1 Tax=Shinella oryzae TaxID=2871820 RepID=A0ABY9K8V1_9HYPH|nr:hypothetical protein [Shinella oryzae]WLS05003.1 hypothetical protein Q9315_22785 [Shinella oryzae]
MQSNQPGSLTREYRLNAQWRFVALVPVAAILFCAAMIFFILSDSEIWWWSFWIIIPPATVAILFAVGLSNMKLTLDRSGLRFRGLGYTVSAPWKNVKLGTGQRLDVTLRDPEVSLSSWMAWMFPVTEALFPWRARLADASLRRVPLWYFDDGTAINTIEVMRHAGEGTRQEPS